MKDALLIELTSTKSGLQASILHHYRYSLAREWEAQNRRDMVIAGASGKVMNLFKLTRMDRVFEVFPTREDALARIS
jgi:hypothetical protein